MKHPLLSCILLAVCTLALVFATACHQSGDDRQETEPDTAASATEPETGAPDTQTEPEEITMTEAETTPEVKAPDGIFESFDVMSGFTKEKNDDYLSSEQCDIIFNEDGSLTLKGTWSEGKQFMPALTVSYMKLMKACCPAFTDSASFPNAGDLQYKVVVIEVKADKCIAGESTLYFSTGKKTTSEGSVIAIRDTTGKDEHEYLVFDLSHTKITADYINRLKFTWGWGWGDETNIGASVTVYSMRLFSTLDEVWTSLGIEPQKPDDHSGAKLGISSDQLDDLVKDIFSGDTVRSETVMLVDYEEEKSLLFDIDKVLSVKNYDNTKTYKEGVDYEVRDGKLVALRGGSLPVITPARYYNVSDAMLMTEYQGKSVNTLWGEGQVITNWQVNVTYTHTDEWDGFRTSCEQAVLTDFLDKLRNGDDVTIIFYGDSCTYGAASSFAYGYAPHQKSYAMLFTETLAKLFDGSVQYITLSLPDACYVPRQDVVFGNGSKITFINPSVGGWTSADAASHINTHLAPFIEKYGCDLFVLDIGGNDGTQPPKKTRINDTTIMDAVLEMVPDTSAIIMSTMVCNPDATNGWIGQESMQEPLLVKLAESYQKKGIPCAPCRFTSTHLSVLDHVEFKDVTGNNINHPNDFLCRIYACTLIETVLGYENFD